MPQNTTASSSPPATENMVETKKGHSCHQKDWAPKDPIVARFMTGGRATEESKL